MLAAWFRLYFLAQAQCRLSITYLPPWVSQELEPRAPIHWLGMRGRGVGDGAEISSQGRAVCFLLPSSGSFCPVDLHRGPIPPAGRVCQGCESASLKSNQGCNLVSSLREERLVQGCGYGHETPSSVGLGLHSEVPLRDSWSCSRTPFTSRGLPVLQQRRCPWLMPVARGLSVLPAQTVGSDPLTGTGRALGLETCVIHHSLSDAEGFPQAVGKAQTRVFETGPEHTPHRQTKYGFNPA